MEDLTTFTSGQLYGNDLTIEVLKRTEKTVTIKTNAWGVQRVKIRKYNDTTEAISFKAWYILATEKFDKEEATKISYEKAYYS